MLTEPNKINKINSATGNSKLVTEVLLGLEPYLVAETSKFVLEPFLANNSKLVSPGNLHPRKA